MVSKPTVESFYSGLAHHYISSISALCLQRYKHKKSVSIGCNTDFLYSTYEN